MSKSKESQKQVFLNKIARYEKAHPVASASLAWHTRTAGVIHDYYVTALDTLTRREAVKDLETKFKKIQKREAEQAATFDRDTPVTAALYRRITGACEFGTRQFLDETGLRATGRKSITASELVEIFEARGRHDYGAQLFKSRCVFI